MKLLDLTLPTPAENLALDEALLESAEQQTRNGHPPDEVLRFWESDRRFVVLGRGSSYRDEVNLEFCERNRIPILRRSSGGATVVNGPGCLNYGLVLSYERRPQMRMIDMVHRLVIDQLIEAISGLGVPAAMKGTCDIIHDGRKVSGNALRCKREWLLYHGTLLYGLQGTSIAECLGQPARQPEYRQNRSHTDFLGTLPVTAASLKSAIAKAWGATEKLVGWPQHLTRQLVLEKYESAEWTRKVP